MSHGEGIITASTSRFWATVSFCPFIIWPVLLQKPKCLYFSAFAWQNTGKKTSSGIHAASCRAEQIVSCLSEALSKSKFKRRPLFHPLFCLCVEVLFWSVSSKPLLLSPPIKYPVQRAWFPSDFRVSRDFHKLWFKVPLKQRCRFCLCLIYYCLKQKRPQTIN